MYEIQLLEEESKSDVVFEVRATTKEELFIGAAIATMSIMVDLNTVNEIKEWNISLSANNLELLLFDFLSELVYLKDAEEALFKSFQIEFEDKGPEIKLNCKIKGEPIDREKHKLLTDVKAVTLFNFTLKQLEDGRWYCYVLLDL